MALGKRIERAPTAFVFLTLDSRLLTLFCCIAPMNRYNRGQVHLSVTSTREDRACVLRNETRRERHLW